MRRSAAVWLAIELLAYNLALIVALPAIVIWLIWRRLVRRKPMGSWAQRLGFVPQLPEEKSPRIWVHAVSAGEMGAARPVVAELRRRLPGAAIALSTHTDTGMEVARKSVKEADVVFYFPFDWPDTMALAMWRLRPDLLVIVEKELWPNFLGIGRLFGARVLGVNGRVSDRMMARSRWAGWAIKRLYRLADRMCVQSAEDAARLRRLGVEETRILVAGSTKADTLAERNREVERRLREELAVGEGEAWLVAGSTHAGEEEQVVEAFLAIREELPEARLLLAPRHPERVAEASATVAQKGLQVVRRSEGRSERPEAVVVLDTMGELRAAYALATAGFVGGTFVPVGGHNLLEPVAAEVPVLFGPHTESCADTAELVLGAEVGFRVSGAGELAAEFVRLARSEELRRGIAKRAQRLIADQRGASARCAEVAEELLKGRAE